MAVTAEAQLALSLLQLEVFVGRGIRVVGNEGETRFRHPRAVPVDERQLPDRRDHGLLVDELLDAVQDRLPPLPVELARLLLYEALDVRVASVGERAAGRHEGVEPGRRVPEGAARGLDDVLELLLAVLQDERHPLQWAQLGPY